MLSRFRRSDDGSIAVLAAVTFPLVLLSIALAVAAMVWTSSEHETQRAADAAAARAAATAFLGTDFPYQALPGVTEDVTYPDVGAIAAWAHTTPPADVSKCGTVGVPPTTAAYGGVSVAGQLGLTLVQSCPTLEPFKVPPPLTDTDQTRAAACATARATMAGDKAPYANRFFDGAGDAQPSCELDPSGARRIDVKLATGSPLVGFGQYAADQATGALNAGVPPQFGTVAELLGAFGIHLGTSLPSLLCPEVSVTVQQPVREPVFDRASTPNGASTARRIVKNAVVLPVYQGQKIEAAQTVATPAVDGVNAGASGGAGAATYIPAQNVNAGLISAQKKLLTLLDEVDAIADAALRAGDVTVDRLNGTDTGIDPTETQPPTLPGTGPLQGLRLTKCLRDTLTQIYDPPSGDAPTAEEVLAAAAASGEEVVVVQVGAVRTACTAAGAVQGIPTPSPTDGCVHAATTPRYDALTGTYEVPFFDATPVLVQDVGGKNFEVVPVHASQASGAFRSGLVRDPANERYDPDVRQPVPTPACLKTLPAPTPTTACDVLSYSPSPLPTVSPPVSVDPSSPPPTVNPTLPTVDPTILPTVPLPTVPTTSSSPPPTSSSPTPTPTSSCSKLVCVGTL